MGARRLGLSVLALVLACSGNAAAADRGVSRAPEDEASVLAGDDEGTLNASSIAILRRRRDAIHRGAPIALMVTGAAVAALSIEVGLMRNLGSIDGGPKPSGSLPAGWHVAGGIGASAAIVGLVWLVDCNIRRGKIEDRIDKLSRGATFDSVTFDASSARLTLGLSGHF